MFTQKLTIAASIAVLSATLLASNANASDCADLTSNQLLAAIERGQCEVVSANAQNSTKIVVKDEYIRTTGGDRTRSSGKSGGGYGY